MPDLSQFLPLVTLIGRSGEETSEFKAAKSNGWIALATFLLGLLAVVADCATKAFDGTHAGIWIGAAGSIIAAVLGILSNMHYAGGRLTVKQKATALLQAVQASASAVEKALAENPAPAPVVAPAAPPVVTVK